LNPDSIRIRNPEKIKICHPDHFSESLETIFGLKIIYILDADPDPGSGIFLTVDLGSGMEKFGPGSRDTHPGSATLVKFMFNLLLLGMTNKSSC
jgi:hypothetical protein